MWSGWIEEKKIKGEIYMEKKIVMYCRLSNERDSAYQTEKEERIESNESKNRLKKTDEENK